MKKVLISIEIILCFLVICINEKIDINTYKINNKFYYEENTNDIDKTNENGEEEKEIEIKEPYKINISSFGAPSTSISSDASWTLEKSIFGFRVSLVKATGAQIGVSVDYTSSVFSPGVNKISYNSSSRKSKTYIINNNVEVKFNGKRSNLEGYKKLPSGITKIDDIDEYFKNKIYVDDKYSESKIKSYIKSTFNQDLSNSCLNDYYILIEPLLMIKSDSISTSLIKYYFGTPTELAYLMKKESKIMFNVDEMAHYMYYDNKKTEFSNFVLSPGTASVAGINDILGKTGYGVGVVWVGSTKNGCGQSDDYYCMDETTGEQISIKDCIDYTIQDRPVVNYTKKYKNCGSDYNNPNANGICTGKTKITPTCTNGTFVVVGGKGYCKITNSSFLRAKSGSTMSSDKTYCRYTSSPVCRDGYSWNSSSRACVKIDNSIRKCSSGTYTGSTCQLVNYNNCVSWNQSCTTKEVRSFAVANDQAPSVCARNVRSGETYRITNTNRSCGGKVYHDSSMSCCRYYKKTCTNTTCKQYGTYTSTAYLTCNGLNNSTIRKEGNNCVLYNFTTSNKGAITCQSGYYYSNGVCNFDDRSANSFYCDNGYSVEKTSANAPATCYKYVSDSTLKCANGYHLTDNNTKCVINDKKADWDVGCPSGYEYKEQSWTGRCLGNYLVQKGLNNSELGCCSREVSENEAKRICTSQKCSGTKICGVGMNEENFNDSIATKKDITECFKANIVNGYTANTALKLCEVENCYSSCSKLSDYGKLSKRDDNEYQKCLINQLKNSSNGSYDSDISLDEDSDVAFDVVDEYCRQSYCKNNCFDISLTEETLNQSLKCINSDTNNNFTFEEDVIQTTENSCELGSTRKYGRHLKEIGNCDIYCTEKAIASLPGNVSKKLSKGMYFEWPTENGQYPLSITIESKCHVVINDGTSANSECRGYQFVPEDFLNVRTNPVINIETGTSISGNESKHKYSGSLEVKSDQKMFLNGFNGYVTTDREVTVRRIITYKLNGNVNRYYNKINDNVSSSKITNKEFDREKGNVSTSVRDKEDIYNLKLNFVSGFGTENSFGKRINENDYTCDYELSPSLTVSGICKCPSGTQNYNEELPFACSNESCAELQAKYCDLEEEIPVCENTCKGNCEWKKENEVSNRLNINKKYCNGSLSYCEIDFTCPNNKVMSGDAKTCVLTKLRNKGYITNNDLSIETVEQGNLESVLKECMPIVCTDNLNKKIVFRVIDLNDPFPGMVMNGSTNKFSNSSINGRYPGSNWDTTYVKNKILNGRQAEGNEIYSKEPLYTIKLTPKLMKTIREYNKNNKYSNFDLNCLNSKDESACISRLLHNELNGYKTEGLLTTNINNKVGKCNNINSSSSVKSFNQCYTN